jgi:hypothetical protein
MVCLSKCIDGLNTLESGAVLLRKSWQLDSAGMLGRASPERMSASL